MSMHYVKDEDIPKEGFNNVDDSECVEHKLPPLPTPLRPPDKEVDPPIFDGDLKDFKARIRHKLMLLWFFYAKLRYNQKLELLLAKESDKESDEYIAKCTIVDILDELSKCLIGTNLMEELKYLYSD